MKAPARIRRGVNRPLIGLHVQYHHGLFVTICTYSLSGWHDCSAGVRPAQSRVLLLLWEARLVQRKWGSRSAITGNRAWMVYFRAVDMSIDDAVLAYPAHPFPCVVHMPPQRRPLHAGWLVFQGDDLVSPHAGSGMATYVIGFNWVFAGRARPVPCRVKLLEGTHQA